MQSCQRNPITAAQVAYGRFVRVVEANLPTRCARWVFLVGCCLVFSSKSALLFAAKPSRMLGMDASTSAASRKQAIQAIPLKKIHSKYRSSVRKVLTDSSVYRRMPTQMVDCDPKLFTFLSQNPEMLVEMWQHLGISRVSLQRRGANKFFLSDGAGTTGDLVIVEQQCEEDAQNRIVMYSEGAYEGKPFKRPVRAQCVLLLQSGSRKETNGRDYVACRLDSFVRIERTSVELFAKAMHPWVGKTADANFADTITFISNLSQAAEQRPEKIVGLINSLPRVAKGRQQQLVDIAYQCSEKYDEESPRVARQTK